MLSNAYISVVKKFIQFWGKNNAKIKHLEHLQKFYKCLKHFENLCPLRCFFLSAIRGTHTLILNLKLWMFQFQLKQRWAMKTDVKMLKNILHSDENTEFKC